MTEFLQKEHLLQIDTILSNDKGEQQYKSDPLLLVKVDGVEGISKLYAYDLIMLRDAGGAQGEVVNGKKRPPIDTTKLIGTHAEIGMRPSVDTGDGDNQGRDIFFKRVGMFETFEDLLGLDITHFVKIHMRDFHIYRARVVPWVKVLTRDIRYRVFEKKTVVEILEAIADEAKQTFPHLLIDTKGLSNPPKPFAPIDYCVQFGESTFAFMSRLMARFGIWYYFGHAKDGGDFVINETMFLKGIWDKSPLTTAGISDVKIADDGAGVKEIGKLVRRFRPPERRVAVGGFNYLDPSNPFYQDDTVDPSDDLLKNEGGAASESKFSGTTSFAQPVFSKEDANALDTVAASENQTEVFLLSGVNQNQTFIPGHTFKINKDKDFDPTDVEKAPFVPVVDKTFLIDVLALSANDYHYVLLESHIPGGDFLLDALLGTINALSADATDQTNNNFYRVSLWATATAEAMIYSAIDPLTGNFADTASGTAVDVASAISTFGGASSAIPVVGSALSTGLGALNLKKAATDEANLASFAVAVIAVPADAPVNPPLPAAVRPLARGPHTALVIGPDDGSGIDLKGHDIYCDALGRVRIRFPWDPGPPQPPSKIPPVFPFAASNKPTKVGGNTCWVRVSEGWAGRTFGTQFLPRIGEEVVVDFLDGDPERPLITGRLYNADRRVTNLPFPIASQQNTQLTDLSKLPDTAGTDPPLSGIKTWSIPSTDSGGSPLETRFHLLRFDDTRDKEQYLIRSQRRLDITALERRYESISSDRHLTVGGKKLTPPPKEIGGDYIAKVFKDYHLHVGDPEFPFQSGNRNTKLEGAESLSVGQNSDESIGGNWSVSVGGGPTGGGVISISALQGVGTISVSALTSITLMCGASSIVLTPAGISINSTAISLVGTVLGAPPVPPPAPIPPIPPIPAAPLAPKDPIAADPGDSLTPPKE